MIEVTITMHGGKTELARVRLENLTEGNTEHADYSVQFAVRRGRDWVGLHRRGIFGFPRKKYNALALLKQALETIDPEELELEDGFDPSDMAGQVRGALPPFPA